MKIAVYAGSFDPVTIGHIDIIERAVKIFDKVIVLVAINPNKNYHSSIEQRKDMIKEAVTHLGDKVEVDAYEGLTMDYAKEHNANALIRGIRVVGDFDYEWQLASANELINPDIDTLFLMAHNKTSFISSSTINKLYDSGVDISELVPASVLKYYKK